MPLSPATRRVPRRRRVVPIGVTAPSPVTATLRTRRTSDAPAGARLRRFARLWRLAEVRDVGQRRTRTRRLGDRSRRSRSRRWRPELVARAARAATAGATSRSGTAFAACSRTSAASSRCGRATGGRCCATSRSCARSASCCRRTRALDGEIVIARDGALDFDAMQMRLHPAESRDPQAVGARSRPTFVAFDLLLWDGEPVRRAAARGAARELERVAGFRRSRRVPASVERGARGCETLRGARASTA